LHAIQGVSRKGAVLGKQAERPRWLLGFIKDFQSLPPGPLLAVIDLSQKQDLPLHDPARTNPTVLDHAPVAVLLAVLDAPFAAQKHAQHAS
jgi:hypothetical protein